MKKISLIFVSFSLLSSCLIAPIAQSYREGGFTSSSRYRLFKEAVKDFYHFIYWKRYQRAISYLDEADTRRKVQKEWDKRRQEKMANYKLKEVRCNEDVTQCKVVVEIAFFSPTNPVVSRRSEVTVWDYKKIRGWRIVGFDNR